MGPKILVLGMPRTGTQSIGEALRVLGYQNIYHMTTVGPNDHHDKWVAALEAKFEEKGTEFGRKEFDELLGDFDATSDIPTSIFYQELMTAYPEASLILTTRDEDAWVESMSKTLHLAYSKAQAAPSKLAKMYNLHLWGDDFLANGRRAFRTHNESVLKVAAGQGRRVLVLDPSQGWEPLCQFLGKAIPEGVAYPRKDMWTGYKQMVKDVEAGRLTEDAITIKNITIQPEMVHSVLGGTKEGIKAAYIYTQSKESDVLRPTGEGVKAAYIYTQSKEKDVLQNTGEGIKAAYIYTQSKERHSPQTVNGIQAAYIYTQSKEKDVLKNTGEGIRAAYIYTQSKERDAMHTVNGIRAAYIYTQSKEKDLDILQNTGEGIRAAYIYTQSKEKDSLRAVNGIQAAYIYTQSKEKDILQSTGEGIRAAYIYTQSKENDILGATRTGEGIKAAYIYTQ